MFKVKRIYDPPEAGDGYRVLIDRLWPRGLKKAEASMDLWLKEIAPSTELRKWYHGTPGNWDEFRRRYLGELGEMPQLTTLLKVKSGDGPVTLLYALRDTEHNHALVLKDYLEQDA